MQHKRLWGLLLLLTFVALSVMPTMAHVPGGIQEGWFSALHWTPRPGSNFIAQNVYYLNYDDGHQVQLDISNDVLAAAGGLAALKGRRVQVAFAPEAMGADANSKAKVASIQLGVIPMSGIPDNAMQRAVSGSQPWVTLLCAFPGTPVGADTDTLAYFQDMYSDQYPGMDHYWREQSYGQANLLGSQAYGWFDLPNPQTHYFPTPGSGMNIPGLEDLLADCTAAAASTVDFSPYIGINLMFNGDLDCCAWGGSDFINIDGVSKYWRLTWNPPWSWRDITVVSHEVGHGFGLPHSNNFDGDENPYDNPWDVMSNTWLSCGSVDHPTYGCLGQHTNAYHKDSLGWIAPANRLVVESDVTNVTLDHLALANPVNYQIAVVPIPGSNRFYTVEARQNSDAGYDLKLPGKAINIYEVDETRTEPAWLVGGVNDATSGSVATGLDGAWLVGETFSGEGVEITIVSETTEGFVININVDGDTLVLNGGMESDTNGDKIPDAWSGKNVTSDGRKCNKDKTGDGVPDKIVARTGNCAYLFKGAPGENSKLAQNANLSAVTFTAGDDLELVAYVNASSAATTGKISAKVIYSSTSLTKDKIVLTLVPTSGYQQLSGNVTLQSGSISKIKVQVQNTTTAGKVYVDDVSLNLQ